MDPDLSYRNSGTAEGFIPAQASEPYFDSVRGTWVLSRYTDVLEALRNRALVQSSSKGKEFPALEEDATRAGMFRELKNELRDARSEPSQALMESEAQSLISGLAGCERVDLVGDVALQWSVAVLARMSGASASRSTDFLRIAAEMLYRKAFCLDLDEAAKPRWLQEHTSGESENPETELEYLIERREVAISKVMFLAFTQSLTNYFAKSWLALLSNPDQMDRLSTEPGRLPNAGTEFLRYSGIVQSLYRKALQDVTIGATRIGKGELVELKVAAANFDPQHFSAPDQLNTSRSIKFQLSLGAGLHACPGSSLVRQAFAIATSVVLTARPKLIPDQRIVWMGDSTLRWPLTVWATFEKDTGG